MQRTILESLQTYCIENERVCPMPMRWKELWQMLPNRLRNGREWAPPLPLILSAWAHTSANEKQERFREHLQWGAEHGALGELDRFLRALPEEQWLHVGECSR